MIFKRFLNPDALRWYCWPALLRPIDDVENSFQGICRFAMIFGDFEQGGIPLLLKGVRDHRVLEQVFALMEK